ncbi:MAG: histidine phosphatase family protein [Gammaproteobacteria bacterium]|jgi:alpha-ribazole phosphatase|nr:histidine phosphatase family protein [Gammaproteobacteria bacterium]
MTRIDLIRHGEPEGGRRYRGYGVNDPLTEKGWQQMWASIPETPDWEIIVSSPLARCLDFAQALAAKTGATCIVEEAMKEIGFGVWEGLTPEEILAQDSQALDHFYADPVHNRPEGAEDLDAFSQRVWQAYLAIAEAHKGKHILIVGHAGVARALTANVLNMSLDDVYSKLSVEYAAIVSTVINNDAPPKLVIRA